MILDAPAPEPTKQTEPRFGLIIGAMKSGTTSLFELLAQHPEVCPSKVKEPGFFAKEHDSPNSWSDYLALWAWDSAKHRVAIEASTTYTKVPFINGVPERIAAEAHSGRVFKFIYIMRDPIKRIASQVRHSLYEGWGRSLDEGISDDLIAFSKYAMQLDRYVEVFPRDSLLLLTLEEFRASPGRVLERTCDFLGIRSDFQFQDPAAPRNRGDFFDIPAPVAWAARNPVIRSVIDRLPSGLHRRLRRTVALLGRGGNKAIGRWSLSESEKHQVIDLLSSDLLRLHEEYGIDIARWWGIAPDRLQPSDSADA